MKMWRLKKIAREDWTVESSVVLPLVPSDYPYNLGIEDVEIPQNTKSNYADDSDIQLDDNSLPF